MAEYPTTRITSVKSAMAWIRAEWAEKMRHDEDWYIAGTDGHYLATPRQQELLNKAQKKLGTTAL